MNKLWKIHILKFSNLMKISRKKLKIYHRIRTCYSVKLKVSQISAPILWLQPLQGDWWLPKILEVIKLQGWTKQLSLALRCILQCSKVLKLQQGPQSPPYLINQCLKCTRKLWKITSFTEKYSPKTYWSNKGKNEWM